MSHKEIIKKYGEGVLIDASFLIEEKKDIIPLSPACDIALGGGIPEGSLVTFSGQSGSGKTTSALALAANGQKKEHGSRTIVYGDVEHRLKKLNLQGIHGLSIDNDKFKVIRSTQDKILSAEDHLNIMISLIKEIKGGIFILDSSSALCAMSEMIEDVKANGRASGPKLLAAFCRQIAPIISVNKSVVIIIQHLIADTSGYGSGYVEDGGQKLKYQADVKMRIKYTTAWKTGSGENETRVGQILHWQITKSSLGPPVDAFDSYLRYGYGLDGVTEIISLGCDIGLITKGGSWFTLDYLKDKPKLQGQEKVYAYLKDNAKDLAELEKKVKESLK
jgi:protein RecA